MKVYYYSRDQTKRKRNMKVYSRDQTKRKRNMKVYYYTYVRYFVVLLYENDIVITVA